MNNNERTRKSALVVREFIQTTIEFSFRAKRLINCKVFWFGIQH